MRTIRIGSDPMDHNRNLTREPAKFVRALSQAELDQVIGAGGSRTTGVGSGSGGASPDRLAGALSEAELDAVCGGVVRMAAWPPPPGRN